MNRIKELRKLKGISQIELAKILGISQQTISDYENNISNPDINSIIILANYFNVSIDYLLGETAIENRYKDAERFISALEGKLSQSGYDLSKKSAEEIAEIIIIALELVQKMKY